MCPACGYYAGTLLGYLGARRELQLFPNVLYRVTMAIRCRACGMDYYTDQSEIEEED